LVSLLVCCSLCERLYLPFQGTIPKDLPPRKIGERCRLGGSVLAKDAWTPVWDHGRHAEGVVGTYSLQRGAALLLVIARHGYAGPSVARGAADPDAERAAVLRALEEANWVLAGPRGGAARLGMKRTTLQSLMRRLGIAKPT
jgi:hypothetical protein